MWIVIKHLPSPFIKRLFRHFLGMPLRDVLTLSLSLFHSAPLLSTVVAHSLSHLIKENFKHFRCQFVPTFRRGQCDDSCQLPSEGSQKVKWRQMDKKRRRKTEKNWLGKKERNGLIKLKPFRAYQDSPLYPKPLFLGWLPPSSSSGQVRADGESLGSLLPSLFSQSPRFHLHLHLCIFHSCGLVY